MTFAHGTVRVKSHGVARLPDAAPAVALTALMPVTSAASMMSSSSGRRQPPASSGPPTLSVGAVSSRIVATALWIVTAASGNAASLPLRQPEPRMHAT